MNRLEQKAVEDYKKEQLRWEQMEITRQNHAERESFILQTGMTPEDWNKILDDTDHEPTPEEVSFIEGYKDWFLYINKSEETDTPSLFCVL